MNPLLIKLGIVGIVLSALFSWHVYDKHKSVKAIEDHYISLIKENKQIAEKASSFIKEDFTQKDKIKDAKIKNIQLKYDVLSRSLSERPQRNSPSAPSDSVSCTGRELFRQDGEFLAGEAARADRIKEERDDLYWKYESARQQLERIRNNGKE